MTGWNLQPGCTTQDIDRAAGAYDRCEVCGEAVDDCICPECPKCGEYGNPKCYNKHGLIPTFQQVLLRDWNDALIEVWERADAKFFAEAETVQMEIDKEYPRR